jgi:hypothetical protein
MYEFGEAQGNIMHSCMQYKISTFDYFYKQYILWLCSIISLLMISPVYNPFVSAVS